MTQGSAATRTVYFTRTDSTQVAVAARGCTEVEAAALVEALTALRHIATAYAI